jgi:hypothetical protein
VSPIAEQVNRQREALAKSASSTANSLVDVHGAAALDIVMPVGYRERLSIVERSLEQLANELSEPGTIARIKTVVAVLFDLEQNDRDRVISKLVDLQKRSLIRNYLIVPEVRHSAARSMNSGMVQLRDSGDGFGDAVLKLDDDARFAPGALGGLIRGMKEHGLSVAAPLTIRPDTHVDYADDQAFRELLAAHESAFNGDTVRVPQYVTQDGKIHLAALMMGRAMEYAPYPTPATPNENGLLVTGDLAAQLMSNGNDKFFSEAKGGSEGLRLWSALAASHHADRIGVVKVGVFDRAWGDPSQPISWGRSDADLMETLRALQLLPQGVSFAECSESFEVSSGVLLGDDTYVVKGLDRLPWFLSEIESATLTGLHTALPEQIAARLPKLQAELECLARAVENLPLTELERTRFGTIAANSPLLERSKAILVNGILHLSGSSIESEALGVPMRMFNFW